MKLMILIVVVAALVVGLMYVFPQINFRSMPSSLIEGRLPENKPNWVSSLVVNTDPHYIAPLNIETLTQLSACIAHKLPAVKIQQQDASHLIAYRQSPVFHFVDWLCVHADGTVISSATMGYSDFGKNRELIEQIRALCVP